MAEEGRAPDDAPAAVDGLEAEFVRAAGGKRVAIESPAFTPIPETSIAREKTVEFVYGGVEDD